MSNAFSETSLPMYNANHSTFTLFPKLPVELRLKIWKAASFLIRNVEIRQRRVSHRTTSDYFANQSPPAILHTSREARLEGLKHYRLEFGVTMEDLLERWHLGERNPRGFRPEPTKVELQNMRTQLRLGTIYFNWQADRLCIGALRMWDIYPRCRKNKLRFLAFNVFRFHTGYGYPWSSNLEEVIVFNDKTWDSKRKNVASSSIKFVDLVPGKQKASWERLEAPIRDLTDQFTALTRSKGLGHDIIVPEHMLTVRACKVERDI